MAGITTGGGQRAAWWMTNRRQESPVIDETVEYRLYDKALELLPGPLAKIAYHSQINRRLPFLSAFAHHAVAVTAAGAGDHMLRVSPACAD